MNARGPSSKLGTGFTLLEILITLIILAVGMLGLANLQSKIHVTEIESYQRAHAVLLLQDMVDRINSNRANAGDYASADVLGTGAAEPLPDCDVIANLAVKDRCQWQEALLGASEQGSTGRSGGMIGARGCIEELQEPNASTGSCTPGVYRVTVAWQGLHKTKAPADLLGCGKDQYGAAGDADKDKLRRAIATEFTIGVPRC